MPTKAKFRKKPVVVSAHRLIGKSKEIYTLEGTMIASDGDWIITGVNGEVYPCKDEIFRKTYEPMNEEATRMFNK